MHVAPPGLGREFIDVLLQLLFPPAFPEARQDGARDSFAAAGQSDLARGCAPATLALAFGHVVQLMQLPGSSFSFAVSLIHLPPSGLQQ